jgi:DNA gyrase subunit B
VEKARVDKMLSHEEIAKLISSVGCGIGKEEFDVSKCRYGKIIIMTDADVDGSHIRTLLLTFLFRHMRPLMESGKVFVAQPPLYQVKRGKQLEYLLDDRVLNKKLAELGLAGTALLVRVEGTSERIIDGDLLRSLVSQLDALEAQIRVLSRRGIHFEAFLREHRDPKRGLPKVLATIHRPGEAMPERHYLSDEAAVAELQIRESGAHGPVEVMEARHVLFLSSDDATADGETDLPAHRMVRYQLPECRVLDEIISAIETFAIPITDLFLKREELVTGEMPPAKFVLRAESGELIDLDNLAAVAPGVRDLGRKGLAVKRFKGLGEMNADELWETTMDREKRTLLRVVISDDMGDIEQADLDSREADRIFRLLMGDNVEDRRRFIEENAVNVKNLDV